MKRRGNSMSRTFGHIKQRPRRQLTRTHPHGRFHPWGQCSVGHVGGGKRGGEHDFLRGARGIGDLWFLPLENRRA